MLVNSSLLLLSCIVIEHAFKDKEMFMIQTNEYGTYLNVTVNDQRKKKKTIARILITRKMILNRCYSVILSFP